ncbi:MAG: nitroreductase, partial [Paraglaciecola sp.]
MNFAEFAASRKSVRGFKNKAVSKELVDTVINAAKWAPSSYNTQTWRVHAVTGDVLDRIR